MTEIVDPRDDLNLNLSPSVATLEPRASTTSMNSNVKVFDLAIGEDPEDCTDSVSVGLSLLANSGRQWLAELFAAAHITECTDAAVEWLENTGCLECDLYYDEEAFAELVLLLSLRKYEARRLRRALEQRFSDLGCRVGAPTDALCPTDAAWARDFFVEEGCTPELAEHLARRRCLVESPGNWTSCAPEEALKRSDAAEEANATDPEGPRGGAGRGGSNAIEFPSFLRAGALEQNDAAEEAKTVEPEVPREGAGGGGGSAIEFPAFLRTGAAAQGAADTTGAMTDSPKAPPPAEDAGQRSCNWCGSTGQLFEDTRSRDAMYCRICWSNWGGCGGFWSDPGVTHKPQLLPVGYCF